MTMVPTTAAICGMIGLAAIDLVLNHQNMLAVAVVSALAGWLSHKVTAAAPAVATAPAEAAA